MDAVLSGNGLGFEGDMLALGEVLAAALGGVVFPVPVAESGVVSGEHLGVGALGLGEVGAVGGVAGLVGLLHPLALGLDAVESIGEVGAEALLGVGDLK